MKNGVDLVNDFEQMIKIVIDEKGVYPQQGIVLTFDDKLEINALALKPDQIFNWFWDNVCNKSAKEVIFGLDRSTKEGQGTEFADVLTCCHWSEKFIESEGTWGSAFRIGVINYQNAPRIVRPMDWNNEFWKKTMSEELEYYKRQFVVRSIIEKCPGVSDKIKKG